MNRTDGERMLSSSLLIITKDRQEDLGRALDSVLEQTRPLDQMVVVDSGKDATEGVVQRFAERFKGETKYVRSEPGVVWQRLVGIPECTKDVVFMFDNDTILAPTCIKEMMAVYETPGNEDVLGVAPQVESNRPPGVLNTVFRWIFMHSRQNGSGRVLPSGFGSFSWYSGKEEIHEIDCISGCCQSYRRSVFEQFSYDDYFCDMVYLDDIDFSYRVSKRGRILCTPRAHLRHVEAPSVRPKKGRMAYMQVVNHYYFFKKNMPQDLYHWLCFWWSDLGVCLARTAKGIVSVNPSMITGLVRGHLDLLRGIPALTEGGK